MAEGCSFKQTSLSSSSLHTNNKRRVISTNNTQKTAAKASSPNVIHFGVLISGRFRITGQTPLGKGVCGEVWEAFDKTTNEYVALKQIPSAMKPAIYREIMASHDELLLAHPLMVSPICAVIDDTKFARTFISTKLRREGDLSDFLQRNGPFSLKNARSAIADLLIGLDFLHSQKHIIHRDVKPANLFWDGMTLRIGDFGGSTIGKLNHNILTPQRVTLGYRAPEVLLGSRQYGPKIDLFSAGAVLGELLLGSPLFNGSSEIDQLTSIYELLGYPVFEVENEALKGWPKDIDPRIADVFVQQVVRNKVDTLIKALNTIINNNEEKPQGTPKVPIWSNIAAIMPPETPVSAVELMYQLMAVDPSQRPTAREALDHPFFLEEPKAIHWKSFGTVYLPNSSSHSTSSTETEFSCKVC